MGMFVALAVGYVIGARAGSKDLDQRHRVAQGAGRRPRSSPTWSGGALAPRPHPARARRRSLDGGDADAPADDAGDLVDRVKLIVGGD